LKFCKREFVAVIHVWRLFIVEIRCLVLTLKMPQVTQVAGKENVELIEGQLITMELLT
jgi:hypothetical protein